MGTEAGGGGEGGGGWALRLVGGWRAKKDKDAGVARGDGRGGTRGNRAQRAQRPQSGREPRTQVLGGGGALCARGQLTSSGGARAGQVWCHRRATVKDTVTEPMVAQDRPCSALPVSRALSPDASEPPALQAPESPVCPCGKAHHPPRPHGQLGQYVRASPRANRLCPRPAGHTRWPLPPAQ